MLVAPAALLLNGALLSRGSRIVLCSTPLPGALPDEDCMADAECLATFVEEFNSDEHRDELLQIARKVGDADGVDWSVEELSAVRIVGVDDEGITVEEILCSTEDQRCIAVPLQVRWPTTAACPRTAAEMRASFAELSSAPLPNLRTPCHRCT